DRVERRETLGDEADRSRAALGGEDLGHARGIRGAVEGSRRLGDDQGSTPGDRGTHAVGGRPERDPAGLPRGRGLEEELAVRGGAADVAVERAERVEGDPLPVFQEPLLDFLAVLVRAERGRVAGAADRSGGRAVAGRERGWDREARVVGVPDAVREL